MRNQYEQVRKDVARKILSGQITYGRLMSPEQVQFAVQGRSGPEGQLRDWCIATALDKRMFGLLKRAMTWNTHVAIQASGAQHHLLVSHSIDDWRHHTVVPLIGPTMARFLSDAAARPWCMSLANGADDDALIRKLSLPAGFAAGVDSSPIDLRSDITQAVESMMLFAGLMTLPEFQPANDTDERAKNISVSVVAPDDLQEIVALSTCVPESSVMN